MSVGITARFSRVQITNTSGVAQTVFSARAYMLAHGGAGGSGGGGGGGFAADTRDATVDANFAAALIGMLTNTRVASLDNVTANFRRNLGDAVSGYSAAGRAAASTYGEWTQAVLTGRRSGTALQFPIEGDQVVNFAGAATTLISLLTTSVVAGVDTIGAAVIRPIEARAVGSYDGISSAGFIALYTVANMFGRDTTGAGVVRPVEVRDATADGDFAGTLFGALMNCRNAVYDRDANDWGTWQGDNMNSAVGKAPSIIRGGYVIAQAFGRDTTGGGAGVFAPIEARSAAVGNVGFENGTIGALVNARQRAAIVKLTATAAIDTGVTLTLPAAASVRAQICRIRISKFYGAAIAAAAAVPDIVTTTNLSGISWDTAHAVTAQGNIEQVVVEPALPIEGDATATATTIVAPAVTGVIWKLEAEWFNA
jgi:hypothetical protein